MQHIYTEKIITAILTTLNYKPEEVALASAIVGSDPIGSYLQGGGLIDAVVKIKGMAEKAKLPIDRFFQILLTYYTADTAAYTADAQGKESLDYLFKFDHANRSISFDEMTNKKVQNLKAAIILTI
ncbi:MAG: hypothetical protein HY225_01040 [Candidatus Vogelbacteria bacterium]|nr:hypothetical protein [Candidatus Vogelbacteria bacterium]